MTNLLTGFLVWEACGVLFATIGIKSIFSKKQVGFWANIKTPKVECVKEYNRAVGVLWIVYGIVFCLLGIPFLVSLSSALVMIPVLGVVFETIAIMAVYMRIEQKYTKK